MFLCEDPSELGKNMEKLMSIFPKPLKQSGEPPKCGNFGD